MCSFFSFILDGRGKVKYFTVEQRKGENDANSDIKIDEYATD